MLVVHPKNRFHNLGNLHGNSWSNEDDNEMVDTEPIKNNISPKIYDQRTPLKKSKGMYNTEIVLSSDSSSDFSNKTEGNSKSDKTITTSSSHTSFMIQRRATERSMDQSLVDVILDEVNTRAKCSKIGESHCYKTLQ